MSGKEGLAHEASEPPPADGPKAVTLGRMEFRAFLLIWTPALVLAIAALVVGNGRYLLNTPPSLNPWLWFPAWTIPSLLCLVLAITLVAARQRSAVAALLSLSVLLFCATNLHATLFWSSKLLLQAQEVLSSLGWLGLILAFLAFPEGRLQRGPAALAAAAFLLMLVDLAWPWEVQDEDALHPFLAYTAVALFFGASAGMLKRRVRAAPRGPTRQQIRWVLFGLAWSTLCIAAAALVCGALYMGDPTPGTRLILWNMSYLLLPLGVAALAAGMLVALLRYRLYDAEALMSRSAVYGGMAALAGLLFLAAEEWLRSTLGTAFGSDAARKVAFAALSVTMVTPLKGAIAAWVERRLRTPLARLKGEMPPALHELAKVASMDEMLDEVAWWIDGAVRPRRIAVFLAGQPEAVRGVGVEEAASWFGKAALDGSAKGPLVSSADSLFVLAMPLRVNAHGSGAPPGWLLLGPRPDGTLYDRHEMEVIASVATPIMRSVRMVARREGADAPFVQPV